MAWYDAILIDLKGAASDRGMRALNVDATWPEA
jgi:hypothetical protein